MEPRSLPLAVLKDSLATARGTDPEAYVEIILCAVQKPINRAAMRSVDRPSSRVARAGSRPASPRRPGTERLRQRPSHPADLRRTAGWRRLARPPPRPPNPARRRPPQGAFLAGPPVGGRRPHGRRAPSERRSHACASLLSKTSRRTARPRPATRPRAPLSRQTTRLRAAPQFGPPKIPPASLWKPECAGRSPAQLLAAAPRAREDRLRRAP